MSKQLEEKQEITRGTFAIAGLWVLVAYGVILLAVLVLEQHLGISAETIKTLLTIFRVLAALETMAFAYYFLRRR
jgi:xanthine/uracil permease